MGPKTRSLIETLDTLVSLLREHGEERWASWLHSDCDRLQRGDFTGIKHFLSAFGGMGSLGDLILDPGNGHRISHSDVESVNARLRARLSRAYDLATEISREAVFE
jgi:hypothetical protein